MIYNIDFEVRPLHAHFPEVFSLVTSSRRQLAPHLTTAHTPTIPTTMSRAEMVLNQPTPIDPTAGKTTAEPTAPKRYRTMKFPATASALFACATSRQYVFRLGKQKLCDTPWRNMKITGKGIPPTALSTDQP